MCCYFKLFPRDWLCSILRSESMIKATSVVSVMNEVTWPLTWPLLHQNYHNIHHLWPYIPFYYYSDVWVAYRNELMDLGTDIRPLLGSM